MGTLSTKLRIWNPATPGRVEELDAVVDTGAAYSWVARARLEVSLLNKTRIWRI